jgi:hypothetical protein
MQSSNRRMCCCDSHGHYKRAFESLVQLSVDLEEDFLLKAVEAGLDAARIGLYHHLDMQKVNESTSPAQSLTLTTPTG